MSGSAARRRAGPAVHQPLREYPRRRRARPLRAAAPRGRRARRRSRAPGRPSSSCSGGTSTPTPVSTRSRRRARPCSWPRSSGPAGTVLDPACGTGDPAVRGPRRPTLLHGQDADPDLAALTGLRLALAGSAAIRTAAADSLRADAYPELRRRRRAVPPAVQRAGLGPRRTRLRPALGVRPPGPHRVRTRLGAARVGPAARGRHRRPARCRPPPPPAAPGRRIRADLLRARRPARGRRAAHRGRAAVRHPAAPVGAAQAGRRHPARSPSCSSSTPRRIDGVAVDGGRDRLPWPALRAAVLDAWTAVRPRRGRSPNSPGSSRSVPVIELLDDDVDLAPARHLPPPAAEGRTCRRSTRVRERLDATLRLDRRTRPAARDHASRAGRPPAAHHRR